MVIIKRVGFFLKISGFQPLIFSCFCCYLGISGWFPLVISNIGYDVLPATEQLAGANCVGGLEVNISFSSAEDRMAILQAGTKL